MDILEDIRQLMKLLTGKKTKSSLTCYLPIFVS